MMRLAFNIWDEELNSKVSLPLGMALGMAKSIGNGKEQVSDSTCAFVPYICLKYSLFRQSYHFKSWKPQMLMLLGHYVHVACITALP